MVFTGLINGISIAISKFQDMDTPAQRKVVLYGSSVMTSLIALSIGIRYLNSSNNTSDLAPALTEDETKKIIGAILDKVKLLAAKMVNAAQNIKQQIQAQGQDIEDSRIMTSFILPHFTSGYKDIKTQVLNEFEVDEYELEDAVKTYISEGDEKIREMVSKIRKLYQTCGGEVDPEDESEAQESSSGGASKGILPLEVVLEMLQVLSEIVAEKTDEYIIAFKAKYGVPEDQDTAEAFQRGLMSLSESAESIIEERYEVSHSDFEKSLMAYSNRRELQEVYFMMQHSSTMKLQQHGLIPQGMGM